MRPSHRKYDDLAFDEIESMQRRARSRELAQMRIDSRNHFGPADEDDEFDDDDWSDYDDDYDDYDGDEWDNYS